MPDIEVVCETPGCNQFGLVINVIKKPDAEAAELIIDQWSQSHENNSDVCSYCGQLGHPYLAMEDDNA